MSCGTAYTASVPRVVCCQTPSANSFFASLTSPDMSASASLLTRVGSAWYSACTRSGALPGLVRGEDLGDEGVAGRLLLHRDGDLLLLAGPLVPQVHDLVHAGAQLQYVSVTGPDAAPSSSDDEPQAASAVAPRATATAELTRRRRFVYGMDVSLTWGPADCGDRMRAVRGSRCICERSQ